MKIWNEIKNFVEDLFNIDPVPPPVASVEAIKKMLDSEGKGVWKIEGGYSHIGSCTIKENGTYNIDPSGIVVKVFINSSTGEARSFVARWLDIPERKFLWKGRV